MTELPTRVAVDAAIAADLLGGHSLNSIARRHCVGKRRVMRVRDALKAGAGGGVLSTKGTALAVAANTGADTNDPFEVNDARINLAEAVARFVQEAFLAQRALARLAASPAWQANLSPAELAGTIAVLNERGLAALDRLAPNPDGR
jgi:hypothetical protein